MAVLCTGVTNFSNNLLLSQNSLSIKLRYDCSECNLHVFSPNIKTSLKREKKNYFCFTIAIPRHTQSFKIILVCLNEVIACVLQK